MALKSASSGPRKKLLNTSEEIIAHLHASIVNKLKIQQRGDYYHVVMDEYSQELSNLGESFHEIVSNIEADIGQPVTPYSPLDGYDPLGYGQAKYTIDIILIFAS